MKKFLAAIKRSPKRSASILMVAAAVIVPAALYAWGPDRPTYTFEHPADHVTFNSITNNPKHGDERNFVQIKEATAPNSAYGEEVKLQPGKDYNVYVYYHNNASTVLNDEAHGYKGIAKNTSMRVEMPAGVNAGEKARITAHIGASNAQPQFVWDEAYGTAEGDYALRYVPGSATIHSNGAVNGQKLPDALYTTGTPLGFDKLDGTLPGCNEYAGYVIFTVHVDQPNFTVEKQVSQNGKNTWSEEVTAKPGEMVDYKIQYKNTGTTKQDNISIRDTLPAGLSYVAGSTQIATSATSGKWISSIDGVTSNGIELGSYLPGGNAYVTFKAKVTDNDKLEKCGINTLINTATAQTGNGNKSDTANVIVSKECTPPATPIYTCDSLKATKIDRTNFSFTGKATAKNGAEIVNYIFNFGDGKSITVTNPTDVKHTYTKEGTYTIKMSVTFKVNGKDKVVNGPNCTTKVTVEKPSVEKIEVCDLDTKKVITIDEKDFNAKKHSKDLNDCKETPVTPPVEKCEVPGKEHLPKDSKDCVETPITELPTTGASSDIMTMIGAGSLIAAVGYYVASRRTL